MNNELEIIGVSEPFFMSYIGIEFVAGACFDGKNIVVSYGSRDSFSCIAHINPNDIKFIK